MKLYLDISEFLNNRFTTGIQRVVREFLQRVLYLEVDVYIIKYDKTKKSYTYLNKDEVTDFLQDIKNYNFTSYTAFNLFKSSKTTQIFFDIDSVWNSSNKRKELYPKLKQHNFKIYNFIYDLIPVLFTHLVKEKTKNSFEQFLTAVYGYSDFVFFDSSSAKNDFLQFKIKKNFQKEIVTKVVPLGSNFKKNTNYKNETYKELLNKKYILFVGTIEPRKLQPLLVEVFEELYLQSSDLHIVLIGSIGWKVEKFASYLDAHFLKEKNIHHLKNIDDKTLSLFYQNAFLVTYLSLYEGYGLPIAESLSHGNITITSNNSSMKEVGKDFAHYIDNTPQNLKESITLYLNDQNLYKASKQNIKDNYKAPSWNSFYHNIIKELK